jgi:hypothetical protein
MHTVFAAACRREVARFPNLSWRTIAVPIAALRTTVDMAALSAKEVPGAASTASRTRLVGQARGQTGAATGLG